MIKTVKKSSMFLFVMLGISMLASGFVIADDTGFKWPHGAKAAVVLGYDDALDSQLDNAIPSLNKFHFKGTFFVKLASSTIANRLPEWRKAAKKGHELANHTLFHQCSHAGAGREWVLPQHDLDQMSLEQMIDQVTLSNTMLFAIDGKTERTMTTPCLDQKVAGGKNYVEAIKTMFVGIRDVGGSGVTPDMNTLDPAYVNVILPSEVTGKQLIAVVEDAAAKGTMANFTFHGIGGDYLTVSNEAHEELLKYLAKHKDIYWTDTFINVMKYARAHQKK